MIITRQSRCVPKIMRLLGACERRDTYKGRTLAHAWKVSTPHDKKFVIRAVFGARVIHTREWYYATECYYGGDLPEANRILDQRWPLNRIIAKLNERKSIQAL